METIELRTRERTQMLDITEQVRQCVARSGVREGVCVVYCPHTTAGLTINEHADPDVARDILTTLNKLIPFADPEWRHDEGNSAAHIKACLLGSSVQLPLAEGRPLLGTWQGVFFCEFDGPRSRKVWVRVMG